MYTESLYGLKLDSSLWDFYDLRINIPSASFGSDAINPHTQYSNPIAKYRCGDFHSYGSSFSLGEGNQMICEAAEYIIKTHEGLSVFDLINSESGFYETLTNPLQLRWLSPYSGLPLMAAGLIVNTLIDAASKICNLPAWEYLAKLPTKTILSLINFRHLPPRYQKQHIRKILDLGLIGIEQRCSQLKSSGLPVYFTTWIGHDSNSISNQMLYQLSARGINKFKIKISSNIDRDIKKLRHIQSALPSGITLCVDANQTLSFEEAKKWMSILSELGILWLEEPFAPDNISLFDALVRAKAENSWSCEIVTGENCPNHYTASALMGLGINRFQADPCRMLGLLDSILVSCIAKIENCPITPHAGGSSLDELSPHIQLFNLARVRPEVDPFDSLTENVGFCSRFFASPTVVEGGIAKTPLSPGLLVGLAPEVLSTIQTYNKGVTWLEL